MSPQYTRLDHSPFPNSLLEAMACGASLVCTDCVTGARELLEGGRWGSLVPVGDADALALAITRALDDGNPPDVCRRARDFRCEVAIDGYLAHLGATRGALAS